MDQIELPINDKNQNIYSLKEFQDVLPAFEKSLSNPIDGACSLKDDQIL